jgi:hypothetical protein
MRAIRATIVIPGLFALTSKVIGDPQMALFATFGGFATLVVTNFGGTWRGKLAAHVALAIAGSLAIVIGTLVSGVTWLAAVVSVPVVFAIFFAGVLGPTAASSTTALLFAYVLPVASVGGAATIGSRLEGWWLASAAGALAVLLLSPRSPGDRLRAAAAALATEIAGRVMAAADGTVTDPATMRAAKDRLRATFTGAPYRPTGLATRDQALSSLVQLLDWAAAQVHDAFDGHINLAKSCAQDRALLKLAAGVFTDTAALLQGRDAAPDFEALEQARADATAHLRDLALATSDEASQRMSAANAVHAQAIAVVARATAADALIAAGRADPGTIAAERRAWDGTVPVGSALPTGTATPNGTGSLSMSAPSPGSSAQGGGGRAADRAASLLAASPLATLSGAAGVVVRHASVRSVWFANSLRGAAAIAAAVAVADLTGVQHGFWVVLGTLSVLRTNASGTGATALRALAGTVLGFVIGAALLLGIGTGQTSMWVAFPLAVLIAAYAPGTMPFTIGQAAFTIVIVVLFNLLVPVGWTVGLLRVEDVAIGCAVSAVVGVLFWPRGAASLVGDDLADAFRRGAQYLTQAVDWALSETLVPPTAASAAVTAGLRLDDALRGFLAEQGTKRASKEDLWALVTASMRLRLTANTLAGLRHVPPPGVVDGPACLPLDGSESYGGTPACVSLRSAAGGLADFYGHVAAEVGHPGREAPPLLPAPVLMGPAVPRKSAVRTTAGATTAGPPGGNPSGGSDSAGRPQVSPGGTPPTDPIRSTIRTPRGTVDEIGRGPGQASISTVHPHLLWVQEHLHHLSQSAQMISEPAQRVAQARRRPWWR